MDARARVLIVDDHPMNAEILRKLLRNDYELAVAANGEECLRLVEQFAPHVVILDIMMPGTDGYAICRQLKSERPERFLQVILCSGRGSVGERLRGYENLADDYVVKPFDHGELMAKVRVQRRLWERFQRLEGNRNE